MARPKGSKNKPVSEPVVQAVDAPEAGEISVTYQGAAPVVYLGHVFNPGAPVVGLPEAIVTSLRSKRAFKVSDER